MSATPTVLPEVFTLSEIARVSGVSTAEVRALLEDSNLASLPSRFVPFDQAVEAVELLRARMAGLPHERRLFAPARGTTRQTGMPALASGAFHAGLLAVMVLI